MKYLLHSLFYLDRTLISDNNEELLHMISRSIPTNIHRFPSGTQCFDWTIPKKWSCIIGTLKDPNGKTIIDMDQDNPLKVVNYSSSFYGTISYEELMSNHIYYSEDIPADAIPYRTSYYSPNWGFCMSKDQLVETVAHGDYEVNLNCQLSDGELLIGEAVIKGQNSAKDIILSSYYCHPRQANDGLSGVVLLVQLYKELVKAKQNGWEPKYNYKFLFWPETIGAITAISKGLIIPQNTEYALVATTVGHGNKIHYKKTYLGNHSLDNIVEDTIECKTRDFVPTGSDERQFSSKGVKIPCGVLTATPYQQYKEYHTSKDNLDLISMETMQMMLRAYLSVIFKYESYYKYSTKVQGGEPFLTKYSAYREIGVPGHSVAETRRNWILYYCDGTKNIKDVSKLLNISEYELHNLVSEWHAIGLIS